MKNKIIQKLVKCSIIVLFMSPITTAVSAVTDNYDGAVVVAPTANDITKKNSNETVETTNDSNKSDIVIKDAPKVDAPTQKINNAPKIDAPTANTVSTNTDSNIDDQRGLTKWNNYNGPLASSMTHIYKGVPIAAAKAKKSTADYSYFQFLLKFYFVNSKGQMDTGIAKKFNYNVDTGVTKKTIASNTDPIRVTQAGSAEDNAKLETVYTPADKTKDPWSGGILKFTYTNKVNAVADFINESNLMSEIVHGLGFGAIIQLPKNVTYDQIVKGFQNGELQVATGPGEGTNTWYGNVSEDTLDKIGQESATYNRWQLKDSEKYFEAVPGDKHKMYFSLHRFLDETVTDPNHLNEKDNPITYSFFQYILTAITNHMVVPGGTDPSDPSNFYDIPITFSTEINLGEAIPDGVIGADDEFKTSDTDENLVTSMTKNKLPASPTGTIDMGVQFYGIDQLDTSNSEDWEIKAGETAYEAPMKQKTWTNFIKPVDPSTGKILQYDATKNAYVYDGQISKSSSSQKLSNFAKVWNLYKNKLVTNPQAVKTDKSLSELNKGSDTVTYYTDESDATNNLSPVRIYFSNVVEEAVNHAPVVKDVQLDPITMEEKSEKDINVTGKYSDEDGDDVTLQYKIDDGALKDVTNQVASKNQAKAAKEIAAYQKKMNAKPTVVKKNKLLSPDFYRGVQQPLVGENDTTVIQDDSGQLTYRISLEKSGLPTQTTVGDEITVHARVTADAPQKTKINGQDAYMRLLNSGFFFPFESENGTNGKPLLEEMNNGNGTGGMYSADGTQIAPITTFKQGDGGFDDVTGIGPTWEYGLGGALSGYTIKGTTSYEAEPVDQVYSNTQFTNKGKIINYPKPGIAGQKTNTVNGVPTSAAYVAFRNKMKKTDYLEFTYKYKVGEGAEGLSPNDLKFYAGVYDVSGGSNLQFFRNYIGKSLPGTVINSLSITPDQTEYNDEVLAKDLPNYTKTMTGKYIDSSGAGTKVQYEINPTGTTPSGNAKDANISNGTYSASVTGNWKFGVNTVRFFITSSDKKNSSYSDVKVNLTEKIDPDKDFSFTIPKEEIQALNDKEVGQHTVHVYASDGHLTSQEVKDVTTGDFEVTALPNTAPVADKLTDADGKTLATVTEGIDTNYGMKLTWHDTDGDAVTGQYTISQSSNGATIATGNIDELDNKGTSNISTFNIAGSDMAKLKGDEDYTVTVKINDGKAESEPSPIYMLIVKPKPSLELPEKLSFKEIAVDSTRQLDLRDTGWEQIKRNGNAEVTVQQTTPWTADGVALSLSPIEMISSDDEYNNHRGTPINDKAVAVKFKADGTLDWIDQRGLLQPIGTESLAGSYSTELTWTIIDAAK